MPLYEYECDACGQRFEQIQSFSDPPVEKCPTCGGPVRKLMSMPAIQFKGSGWYITDYARKGQNADTGNKSDTGDKSTDKSPEKKDKGAESGAKSAGSTDRDKSSPASESPSPSSPATTSKGSSSSDS